MTTRMAVPRVKLQSSNPLTLDERLVYGSIPRWITEGVEIRELRIPQSIYAKQLRTLPPLYAGHGSGVVKYGAAPRQESHVRPLPLRSPTEGYVGEGLTAYVQRGQTQSQADGHPFVSYSSYSFNHPRNPTWKHNAYNQHAKEGFKFWLEEKKPVSKSQKYTFGTYKTNLGLGNAPRN